MTSQSNERRFSAISGILTVVVSVAVSGFLSWHTNRNDVSAKYVEMAVGVLSAKSDNNDKALREWAVTVINKYAEPELRISGDLRARLINGESNLAGLAVTGTVRMVDENDTVSAGGTVSRK